jgi:hypothetical protein
VPYSTRITNNYLVQNCIGTRQKQLLSTLLDAFCLYEKREPCQRDRGDMTRVETCRESCLKTRVERDASSGAPRASLETGFWRRHEIMSGARINQRHSPGRL